MSDTPQTITWEGKDEDGSTIRYDFLPDVSHDEENNEITEVHQDGELRVKTGYPAQEGDEVETWSEASRVAFCNLDQVERMIGERTPDIQFSRVNT